MKMSSEQAAAAAGLCYVHDNMPKIERRPWGQGFSYVLQNGDRRPTDPPKNSPDWKLCDRIEKLAIPPSSARTGCSLTFAINLKQA